MRPLPIRVLFLGEAVTAVRAGTMLTLARALDRRRFEPLLAWHPRFNSVLGPLELPYYPLPGIEPQTYFERLAAMRPIYDVETLERYVAWELEVFREAAPQVVVSDLRPSLSVSSDILRLPRIQVMGAHWSPYTRMPLPLPGMSWLKGSLRLGLLERFLFQAHARDINAVRARFGQAGLGTSPRHVYMRGRTIYPDIPELVAVDQAPPEHRFVGPVLWAPPGHDSKCDSDDARPLVYVDLAPVVTQEILDRVLAALESLPVRALIAIGSHRLSPRRAGIEVMPVLPPPSQVPGVRVVVAGGGIGTAQPALVAGVPVLGLTSNMDQSLYMEHVARAGAGIQLSSRRAQPRSIAASIARLLEEGRYREGAQWLAQRMAAWDLGGALGEVIDAAVKDAPSPLLASQSTVAAPVKAQRATGLPVDSEADAKRLADAARLGPSAGNSQPLLFRWTGADLEIRLDPLRNSRFMDLANTDLFVALGAALANMEALADGEGRGLRAELFPDDAREGLLARIRWGAVSGSQAPLAAFLAQRCTNRQPYHSTRIPNEVVEDLKAWADLPGVRLDWLPDASAVADLSEASAVFERMMFSNENVGRLVLKWIRPTRAQAVATADGLAPLSLEVRGLDAVFFRLAVHPFWRWLLRPLLSRIVYRKAARRYRQGGVFGLITVENLRPEAMVDGGKAFERLWLAATRHGLALHPLAGPVLFELRMRLTGGEGFTEQQRQWIEASRRRIVDHAPAFAERVPVALFRTGYAEPSSQRSLRRPLEAVMEAAVSPSG